MRPTSTKESERQKTDKQREKNDLAYRQGDH